MPVNKSISKSVRLTEEVFAYIESAPGKGFNEKFENIILRAQKEEAEKEKRLADLELKINDKLHQLYKLYDSYRYLDAYFVGFANMRTQADALMECVGSAIESFGESGLLDEKGD